MSATEVVTLDFVVFEDLVKIERCNTDDQEGKWSDQDS